MQIKLVHDERVQQICSIVRTKYRPRGGIERNTEFAPRARRDDLTTRASGRAA
jgi:hypothetical protein